MHALFLKARMKLISFWWTFLALPAHRFLFKFSNFNIWLCILSLQLGPLVSQVMPLMEASPINLVAKTASGNCIQNSHSALSILEVVE